MLETVRETLATICPYRGLLYFREEDAPFFFGRKAAFTQLANAVQQHNLVAMVGASGSGKSSVVRAGLVPELRKSRDQVWEVVTMVPTDRPVHALAAVLMPFLEPDMTETDRLIETNKLAEALLSRTIKLREVADRVLAKQPGTDRLQLENERLLVTSQCAGGGEETIEVSHEALIRHWDRLKGWVDADRRFLLWQQRLHILVDQYEESHKSADLLLRGFPLTEALEWVKNKPDSFSVRECQFVTASKNRKERNRSVAGLITGLILESSVRAGCGKMVIPLIRHSSKSSMVFL